MPRHTTVPAEGPARRASPPPPPRVARPSSGTPRARAARRRIARIVDEGDATLLDLVDNLLNRGVVLNADLILALANVDLVYVRLSALLCAADRILPRDARR